MGKDEFAEYLRGQGLKAIVDDGCVMVIVQDLTEEVKEAVREAVRVRGYVGSYGWRKERV